MDIHLTELEKQRLPVTRERIRELARFSVKELKAFLLTPENHKNKSSRDALCILIRHKENRLFPIDHEVAGNTL